MIRDFTSIRLQMIVSSAARHSSTRIVGFERETISTTIDLIVAVCDGHPMLNVLDSRQIQDWRG